MLYWYRNQGGRTWIFQKLFTILPNILMRPLNYCWRNSGTKWRRTSDYTYGLECMNYQRICELSWQSVISVKTISMKQSTWSWKLWLRLMKLECLFMWMKYNNIQKIVLQWIFQASLILSKLDNITTCWNRSWMLMMCHEMRKERKIVMVIAPKNRFLLC